MTELRWILLGAGIAMLVGLYLWGVRARRRSGIPDTGRSTRIEPAPPVEPAALTTPLAERPQPAAKTPPAPPAETVRIEPQVHLEDEPPQPREHVPLRREPTFAEDIEPEVPAREAAPPVEPKAAPGTQRIVALRVTARPPERFDGAQLLEALQAEGLEFGRYEIFHRLDPAGRPIFSSASLVEPGTFDPKTMGDSAYPGVALFAVLPGPVSARQAFEELLSAAHSLAGRLGGGLQDERGAPLSMQRISAMHEEMLEFDRARNARTGH